jgi:hypothetical protein
MVVTEEPPVPNALKLKDWEWIVDLTGDISSHRDPEHLVERFSQWDLVVRRFYKVEQNIFGAEIAASRVPSAETLSRHRSSADLLLKIGREILQDTAKCKDEELSRHGISRQDILASVDCLQMAFAEWHSPTLAEADRAAIQKRIFGAAP